MKILVTGAGGQLGTAIVERYASRAEVIPVTRAALDITDSAAIEPFVAGHAPDVVINCAAYNDVDGAEDHPIDAIRVNALAVRALARGVAAAGAAFVHYGTDFVFDGVSGARPYTEEDEPAPQSVYASSKLLGEWFASDVPRHYVLRVESLFGGSTRRSSVDRIADALRSGQPTRVFVDRTVTPSFVNDVADATWRLLETGAPGGLYHCVNSGMTTWFELAEEISRVLGVASQLVPVKVVDVPMKARRPQYAALSNAKLAGVGIQMPSWQDALRRYLSVSSKQ
ncbi:MAG TPA: dTDP-4-dehydrorhamnose reductase [Vicinamibacterales bacterium]|nr:dTDP-4-dehydrorhamnose reductase [Vicinamibacterales bacterium]